RGLCVAGRLVAGTWVPAQASTPASHVAAKASSHDARPHYPIVFAHGMAGFIRVGTDQFGLDYWYQLLPDLARNGGNVWATRVSPFHSSEIRGEQLVEQVKEIRAITGASKVNLVLGLKSIFAPDPVDVYRQHANRLKLQGL